MLHLPPLQSSINLWGYLRQRAVFFEKKMNFFFSRDTAAF